MIQSLHKWIWLIEGASDPDWCTAGAPLIGEGEEWREEWREKEKERIWPPEKMHLRCNTIDLMRIMPNVNADEKGHAPGKKVMWRLIVAQFSYYHLEKNAAQSIFL